MADEKKEDLGKKFEKGGDQDLSEGPKAKRYFTDILCIPIFLAHAVLFWILTFAGFSDGNPTKLIAPRDYRGDYCGVKENWNNGPDLEKFEYQIWVMNMTSTMDEVAKGLVCSPSGKTVVTGGLRPQDNPCPFCITDAEFDAYCGTGLSANASAVISDVTKDFESTINNYADPTKAVNLFTGHAHDNYLAEATKYFSMSCVKSCNLGQAQATNAAPYTYQPDPSTVWGSDPSKKALKVWEIFTTELEAQGQASALDQLKFNTWSTDDCPYTDRKFCVPFPGIAFEEFGSFGQCMPRMDSGVTDVIGAAPAAALNGVAQLDITEDLGEHTKSFGNSIGDTFKAWEVIVLVGVVSFAISLVALVLMRFVLGPVVWISIFLTFLLIAVAGIACLVRASQCQDGDFLDAASDQAGNAAGTTTSGGNPFEQDCVGGYAVESQTWRDILKVCGYIILGLAAIWLLVVLCMSCRIQLAININKCAAQFMYNNPHVLLVPIIQALVFLIWGIFWIFCAAFLLSQVSDDSVPTTAFASYQDAADQCMDSWPSGDVWKDADSPECKDQFKCWKCMPSRWTIDWKFAYSFFALIWHNYFMLAVLQTVIAGTVGFWFFSGGKGSTKSICVSTKNALLWHAGSLAYGSLIIAIIVYIKWFMRWLSKQAEKKDPSGVTKCIINALIYCIMCFERCIKFLNKNAYIQIALLGNSFCKSAYQAWCLIARNLVRFGVMLALSYMVHFLMYILIIAGTTVSGYFILQGMYEDIDPIVPTIFYGMIGYVMAKLFIGTFALAVDTTLQCFICAEEMGCQDLAPPILKNFIDENQGKEGGWGSTCMSCCCFG